MSSITITGLGGARRELRLKSEQIHKKVVFKLLSDLIGSTPRKTGRAQNGWHLANGDSSWTPPENQVGQDPDLAAIAARVRLALGTPVSIINNVVYIVPLDEGHSQQAPAGMTSIALANLRAIR